MHQQQQVGMFWHLHHGVLLEWCYSYDERLADIKENKPQEQRELRIKLFHPVKGELPDEVVSAGRAYDRATEARVKAWKASDDAWKTLGKAWDVYLEARECNFKAFQVLSKAIEDNLPTIQALHAIECPNCPWDGKTIFSKTE